MATSTVPRRLPSTAAAATSCASNVIVHVDLDCFYAQVEMLRLGVDYRDPFVVSQWGSLIAVNYPARKFNITRFGDNLTTAREKCPELKFGHVPTFAPGENEPRYHPPECIRRNTHKVSLEPYRECSKRIFAYLAQACPLAVIEKGGVDEAFIDLTSTVAVAASFWPQRHPGTSEILGAASKDAAASCSVDVLALLRSHLPVTQEEEAAFALEAEGLEPGSELWRPSPGLPGTARVITEEAPAWNDGDGEVLVQQHPDAESTGLMKQAACDGENGHGPVSHGAATISSASPDVSHPAGANVGTTSEALLPPLDMRIASRLVGLLRRGMKTALGLDCSAGISVNRMLAKALSASYKPNRQAVLLARDVPQFMAQLPIGKLRGFGGKLGTQLQDAFGAKTCGDVTAVPLDVLRRELGGSKDLAEYVFRRVRGYDEDVLRDRTAPKSLLAQKNFAPGATRSEPVVAWARVLAQELSTRIADCLDTFQSVPTKMVLRLGSGGLGSTSDVLTRTFPLDLPYDVDHTMVALEDMIRKAMAPASSVHGSSVQATAQQHSSTAHLPAAAANRSVNIISLTGIGIARAERKPTSHPAGSISISGKVTAVPSAAPATSKRQSLLNFGSHSRAAARVGPNSSIVTSLGEEGLQRAGPPLTTLERPPSSSLVTAARRHQKRGRETQHHHGHLPTAQPLQLKAENMASSAAHDGGSDDGDDVVLVLSASSASSSRCSVTAEPAVPAAVVYSGSSDSSPSSSSDCVVGPSVPPPRPAPCSHHRGHTTASHQCDGGNEWLRSNDAVGSDIAGRSGRGVEAAPMTSGASGESDEPVLMAVPRDATSVGRTKGASPLSRHRFFTTTATRGPSKAPPCEVVDVDGD